TEYVVPDVLEEVEPTIESFRKWEEKYHDLPGKKIGVVQGKTLEELRTCYQFMSQNADKIALSFNYSWYEKRFPHTNPCTSWMLGRAALISDLRVMGVLNIRKPHHLLGCSNPEEYTFYRKDYDFIESVDTSSPVVHAIKGVAYPDDWTRWKKESVKLVDLIKTPREKIDDVILQFNLKRFRGLIDA
ncbi:MAG: hypothetical protein ACREBJ_08120, partial [Nitrosotalea sp.]